MGFVKELFAYLVSQKKLWLVPLIALFSLVGLLLVLSQGSAVAPFIYTLF